MKWMIIPCAFSRFHQVCSTSKVQPHDRSKGLLVTWMESLLWSSWHLETRATTGLLSPHIPNGGRWARSDVPLGGMKSLWQTAYPCMVSMILGLWGSEADLSIQSCLLLQLVLVTAMAENLDILWDFPCLGCTDPAEKLFLAELEGMFCFGSWLTVPYVNHNSLSS